MNRRHFVQWTAAAGFGVQYFGERFVWPATPGVASALRVVGMYVHEGWPYNRPYAARTWTVDDWRGYADGLSKLGFNTIIIWPAIEIMPEPLLPSDRSHLEMTAHAVDILRREFNLRVYITLCPNVVPYPEVAKKYSFDERPLFASTTLSDPGDPVALNEMMRRREELLRPLTKMDGLVLIDSDLGGYPGSTNAEFANLLHEYRTVLNRLRPGIELVYWMHMGWEAFSRYESTGVFHWGDPAEAEDILSRLKKLPMDPWRITIHTYNPPPNGTDLALAERMGLASYALTFNYGALEAEPSFPLTNFGGEAAFQAGKRGAPGGVVGNAQTHCMQLPNTFAFICGAQGKDLPTHSDYVEFANNLVSGQGGFIVGGWQALAGVDPEAMRGAAAQLAALDPRKLVPGSLGGLLFGSPSRFVTDLVMELRLKAAMEDFIGATVGNVQIKKSFVAFVEIAGDYQRRMGYQCVWGWPRLDKALRSIGSEKIDSILAEGDFVKDILANRGKAYPGNAYHNRYSDGLMQLETSTPRLVAAMHEAASHM
jgi:hypothetical protein